MIAEYIPGPGELARPGRDFELGFEHFLVVVVARTQHHLVLAERDRVFIVICGDVPDGENRHCSPLCSCQEHAFSAPRIVRVCTIQSLIRRGCTDERDAGSRVGGRPAGAGDGAQPKRPIAVPDRRRSRRQFAAARPRSARRSGNWRHIAWDIGIGAVCRLVADALGATLVQQNYSRLVIDYNRTPGSETSIPEISEW
jgi:N-formylglutamate amidohydrolase